MDRKAFYAAGVSRIAPQPTSRYVDIASLHKALTLSLIRHGLDRMISCGILCLTHMPTTKHRKDHKADALLEEGTLNPSPEKVSDPKFLNSDFFDPRDVVQVKYEMLRRVLIENAPVTVAANEYGVSRPTFYQAQASFQQSGITGLVPKKRGPHGPRKLRGDLMEFIQKMIVPGKPMRARALAEQIRKEFAIDVHARTIERALRVKKTTR